MIVVIFPVQVQVPGHGSGSAQGHQEHHGAHLAAGGQYHGGQAQNGADDIQHRHRLLLGEAHIDESVVYVAAVCVHGALSLGQSADHCKADIEDGQTQHEEGNGKGDHTTVFLLNFFESISKTYEEAAAIECADRIDLQGRLMLPGFVDSHMHMLHYAFVEKSVACNYTDYIFAFFKKICYIVGVVPKVVSVLQCWGVTGQICFNPVKAGMGHNPVGGLEVAQRKSEVGVEITCYMV